MSRLNELSSRLWSHERLPAVSLERFPSLSEFTAVVEIERQKEVKRRREMIIPRPADFQREVKGSLLTDNLTFHGHPQRVLVQL